ncbi:MAG: thiolase domain-containing protein, partial [Aurantimonas coralicida]|nr:thiolase domain-containing protein [Aurantimonas coralicida]
MSKAQRVGWSHSQFGKSVAPPTQALMGEVVAPALEHAGIGAESVDGVFVGVMNNGI